MEKYAIGIIELSSIHKGFEVTDSILKKAKVEKLLSRTICSGKYIILIKGEIADIESALKDAKESGSYSIINTLYIPNVDKRVFSAISGSTAIEESNPDGILIFETYSAASAIQAADIALKEAEVNCLRIHVAMAVGGKGFTVLTGNIEALKSAEAKVLEYIKDEGTLLGYSLITQPHEDLLKELI